MEQKAPGAPVRLLTFLMHSDTHSSQTFVTRSRLLFPSNLLGEHIGNVVSKEGGAVEVLVYLMPCPRHFAARVQDCPALQGTTIP